ncbi:MAG TPA: aspartate/glutamate racemase family protein [Thermoanaerobaculia bacterium]|jgi:glutamate racemase
MAKRNTLRSLRASAALLVALALAPGAARAASPIPFAEIARTKADVTIVVTDSGLGGLSVAADLAARLPASGIVRSARVVFVNAEPDSVWGYNDLKNDADKVRIFDGALSAMEARWKPDLILIACNTLSVVWPRTEHAKTGGVETVEIVGLGAGLIRRELAAKPDATALVFATKTTIESGAHKNLLVGQGVAPDHVVGEACPKLAGAIERGAASDETVGYVKKFVAEALEKKTTKGGPVVVSLNCTHFGYVKPLWEQAFAGAGLPGVKVLDPNPLMTDLVLKEGGEKRFPKTAVTVEAVSKVPIDEGTRANLGALLRKTSPETADALLHIRHDAALFPAAVEAGGIIPR